MQVKDVMTKEVICVQPDETVAVASRLMARHNLGVLAVCSPDGKLRGMVTDRDVVLRCVAADEDPAESAGTNLVFLVDVSGSMSDSDSLPLFQQAFREVADQFGDCDRISLVTYSSSEQVVLNGTNGDDINKITEAMDSLETASKRMAAQQVRRLPVERDGRLAGMVSLADLTRAPELRMEVAEALCDICDPVRKQK